MMITSIFYSLWEQLTEAEQNEACLAFWDARYETYSESRSDALKVIGLLVGKSLEEMEEAHNDTLARWMVPLMHQPTMRFLLQPVFHVWLHSRPGAMSYEFLGALQYPEDVTRAQAPATEEFLRGALAKLKGKHPPRLLAAACLFAFVRLSSTPYLENLGAAVIAEDLDVFGIFKELASPPPESSAAQAGITMPAWLTKIDDLLIESVLAAASGQLAAPSPEAAEAIVEEFIQMNSSRRQSHFHRGLLHAIINHPFQFHFTGEDEEKRLWYFCGALKGLHRKGDLDGCLRLLEEQKDLTIALNKQRHIRCGELVVFLVFETFTRFGKFTEAAHWLPTHVSRLPEQEAIKLLTEAHQNGVSLLQQGRVAEASEMFNAVHVSSQHPQCKGSAIQLLLLNNLRIAEVKQYQRQFAAAERMLNPFTQVSDEPVTGMAWVDLGLVKGRFQAVTEVLPESNYEKSLAKYFALIKGQEQFYRAIATPGEGAVRAYFCMGVMGFLQVANNSAPRESISAKAVEHLSAALPGMLSHRQDYGADMIAWTKLMLAIALLETNVQASVREAAQYLDDALNSKINIPAWIYKRALEAAVVLDDSAPAERLADSLLEANPRKAYQILWETEIARNSASVRGRYLTWLLTEKKMSDTAKCGQLQELLKVALREGEVEQAKDALSGLERLARENGACRAAFKTLLKDAANYSPAWKARDAEMRLAELCELEGDNPGAAELLKARIRQLLHEGQQYQVAEAEELVARIEEYRLPEPDLEGIKARLSESRSSASQPATDELRANREPVRVLYVGGNEAQKAYERTIRSELTDKYPSLTVAFVYPGWDSGWNKHLEVVTRLIPDADVVVLNNLVHTQFGEQVRAACGSNHPHLPCGGRGKASVKRSIVRAALWACRRKQAALAAKGGTFVCPPPALSEVTT